MTAFRRGFVKRAGNVCASVTLVALFWLGIAAVPANADPLSQGDSQIDPTAPSASSVRATAAARTETVVDGLPVPAFLRDDDSAAIQAAQMRVYFKTLSREELWARHIGPAVAASNPSAAEQGTAHFAGTTSAQDDAASLEAFRADLDDFYADIEELTSLVPPSQRLDSLERLRAVQSNVASYSEEELSDFRDAFASFPGIWDAPGYLLGLLAGDQALPELEASMRQRARGWVNASPGPRGGASLLPALSASAMASEVELNLPLPAVPTTPIADWANCSGYGGDGTCDACPPWPAGGIITLFALQTTAFTAGAVCSYFDGDVFPITGAEIPNPLKIVCSIITTALQIVADSVGFAIDLSNECWDQFHLHIQDAYLDAQISTRASQKSHDHHRLWSLRLTMENALLMQGDDRIALFQLPHELPGQSADPAEPAFGFLTSADDLSIRFVVRDTIDMAAAAGYDIRNAEDEYAAAEAHLAARDYKDAFARYRLAYRAAVRVGRVP